MLLLTRDSVIDVLNEIVVVPATRSIDSNELRTEASSVTSHVNARAPSSSSASGRVASVVRARSATA
jgi:hypothetical protein